MNPFRTSIIIIVVVLGTAALTSCAKKAPECDSQDAKVLVVQIFKGEYSRALADKQNLNFNVVNVRTLSFNKDVGSFQCAAEIEIIGQEEKTTVPINFASELADKGEKFYVSISNLPLFIRFPK